MTTFTSQPNAANGKDTYINSGAVDTNYGTSADILIGRASSASKIALVQFDYSSIPSNATVSAVTLSLWLYANNATNASDVSVYNLKMAWVETEATYNVYSTGNNWQTAGAAGANDFDSTVLAVLNITAAEGSGEKQWAFNANGITAVQNVISGAATNYGWKIHFANTASEHTYRSSDYYATDPTVVPKLAIVYTTPAITFVPRIMVI
jgi:hypothetical protein